MKHEQPSEEDFGRLTHHRLTVPAAMWTTALLFACIAALFDGGPGEPPTGNDAAATAAMVVPARS